MEVWKPVSGYENLYEVSNKGRVRGILRGTMLKPFVSKFGYEIVSLSKDGKAKKFQVHRLVATEFVSNPDELPVVDHIDGDKRNNSSDNLEWCTAQENTRRAFDNGLCESCKRASLKTAHEVLKQYGLNSSIPIVSQNIKTGEKRSFDSISDASRQLGVAPGNISRVLSGDYKQANGYKFAKKGENDG